MMKIFSLQGIQSNSNRLYLLIILFLGFFLRVYAVNFGLPYLYHADEPIVVNHALAFGSGDFNPHFFNIPPFVSYLLFFLYGFFYLFGRVVGCFESLQSFSNLYFLDPTQFYLIGRIAIGVIPGVLTIFLLYKMVKKKFSHATALLSSLLLAVNFLHVQESHYIYVDVILVFVMLYALLQMCVDVERVASIKLHLFLGMIIGLATAIKYNGAFLIFPYFAMVFMQIKGKNSLWSHFKYMVSAGGVALSVFFLLNPFAFLDAKYFFEELREQNMANGGVEIFHHIRYSLVGGMGIFSLILCLFSFFSLSFGLYKGQDKKKMIVLWVFAISYYVVLVLKAQHYSRYVLPLIPVLCLFTGDLIVLMNRKISSFKNKVIFLMLSASMCIVIPATKSFAWDLMMSHADTRTQAKAWVEKYIPIGSPIAVDWDFYMPRLNFSERQLHEKLEEVSGENAHQSIQIQRLNALIEKSRSEPSYDLHFLTKQLEEARFLLASPVVPYDLKTLKKMGIKYIATADTYRKNAPEDFYDEVKAVGKKIAFFSPYKNIEQSYLDQQPMTGGPFLWSEISKRKSNGPIIVIYEI